jgi:hypothetical protein
MGLSPEVFIRSGVQEFPKILWNPRVYYRVRKSPPLVPILSQFIPVHTIPPYLSRIHFNIILRPKSSMQNRNDTKKNI